MKFIVLSGNHSENSYARLVKFIDVAKSRNWDIVFDNLELTSSLFNKERLIIVRDLNLLNKKAIDILKKRDGTLVIYVEGDLPLTISQKLPKETKYEKFELPKLIWSFLDNPNIKCFHELLKKETPEFVFSLFSRRIRDLYLVKTFPETLNLQFWQKEKLKKLAAKYSLLELENIIEKLADMDIEIKTGKKEITMELDLLFLKTLK